MKVHLMELGRGKADIVVDVAKIEDLYPVVGKYLLSSDIELRYDPKAKTGIVVVGGYRTVGRFSVVTGDVPKDNLFPPTISFKEKVKS
jgi:hypothetical protein